MMTGWVRGALAGLCCLFLATAAGAAHNCSTNCSQTSCSTDCNETDLRAAVSIVNACGGNRTITFNIGYGCPIAMAQTSTVAACTGDPEANAVCLTGSNIVIDGQNGVTFTYNGTGKCASDPPGGGNPQPALFTLKGNNNTVKNFNMKYFPEGIHLRTGNNHTVQGVTSQFICEDAVTLDSTVGTGHLIADNLFVGNTTPETGKQCFGNDGVTSARCGIDKAIQINNCGSCTSTIDNNVIDTIGQPVIVNGGTHTLSDNTSTGAAPGCSQGNCDDFCQAYTVAGGMATFTNNTIQRCKFGIRVRDSGMAEANNNTLKDNYIAAFQMRTAGSPKLKGAGNRMKGNGFFTQSDSERGALVDRDNASARIDFGGGDGSGNAVIGGLSAGGNIFCQGSLTDIDNTGAGSCGARSNCFDSAPVKVGTCDTSNNATCSAGQCSF